MPYKRNIEIHADHASYSYSAVYRAALLPGAHHGHDCILVGGAAGAMRLEHRPQVHVGDGVAVDEHKVALDDVALLDDAQRLAS